MCIYFPLRTTERSIFKNKISFSLNCSSEADETLSPLFLLKIKSCVSDCCHYLSWLWSPLLEMFFSSIEMYVLYDLGLSPSMPSATCIGALEAVDEFSTSRTWLQGSVGSPVMPGSEVTVQRIGREEKEPTVLSAGHEHWKSFGTSLQFCFRSQTKYFFRSLFCDSYFFFPFFITKKTKASL